jgi:amino acid adenylation domain-containing protein
MNAPSRQTPDASARFALTQGQRALWFVQQLVPESTAHNFAHAACFRGELDTELLRESFQHLVDRHTVLRTTFTVENGNPVQIVHDHAAVTYSVEDVTALSEDALQDQIDVEVFTPFDLSRLPLFRVHVFRRSSDTHIVLVVFHHITTDMWSIAILLSEVSSYYSSARNGPRPVFEPLETTFAEAVRLEQQWLASEAAAADFAFWQNTLGGSLPTLHLPTDRERPRVGTGRGGALFRRVDATLTAALNRLSKAHQAKLHMTVFAAYAAFLHRLTGQDDILIGTPKTTRKRALAQAIGYFINPIVLRTDLSGDPTFTELLSRVRATMLAAFAHDQYPFALLVERLQPQRDLSRSPFFQVMFSWQKTIGMVDSGVMTSMALGEAGQQMEIQGVTWESFHMRRQAVPFDLTLLASEASGGELLLAFEYSTDLFDRETVSTFMDAFVLLLREVADRPSGQISRFPLLDSPAAIAAGEGTRVSRGGTIREDLLPGLLREHARRQPDKHAVLCRGESITFRELDRRTTALAHALRGLGVGPEIVVGLCMDRSIDAVVGLLAILKAGGVYLPMDPSYPSDRLLYMAEDSHAALLLTQGHLVDRLAVAPCRVLPVEVLRGPETEDAQDDLHVAPDPHQGAYIIYTSGSTGQPKGVIVSHREFARHIRAMRDHYALSSDDRVLQFASFNFDASLEQLFCAFLAGSTLVVRENDLWDAVTLDQKIREERLSVINLPPAYWHQVVDHWVRTTPENRPASLRLVIVGGDAIAPDSLSLWSRARLGNVRLLNAYGPTETTITSLADDLTSHLESIVLSRRVPIGTALPERATYVLDNNLSPVPHGIPGELYVGGACLARGYIGRSDLTAERFLPDPFSSERGARMYKTGDRVRRNVEGKLEFLGRTDYQVKIRGFRVELQEIEALVANYEHVTAAAVVAVDHGPTDKRLVAFAEVPAGAQVMESDLRRYLHTRLPAYMVPATIVVSRDLPRTVGGKIDRRALRIPALTGVDERADIVPPRTPLESELVALWAELLGRQPIGVFDNFFALGGHSLLATQVTSRLRTRYAIDVPLRELFENPTVAHLASVVEELLLTAEGDAGVEDLISSIESLPEEDLRKLLEEERRSAGGT